MKNNRNPIVPGDVCGGCPLPKLAGRTAGGRLSLPGPPKHACAPRVRMPERTALPGDGCGDCESRFNMSADTQSFAISESPRYPRSVRPGPLTVSLFSERLDARAAPGIYRDGRSPMAVQAIAPPEEEEDRTCPKLREPRVCISSF